MSPTQKSLAALKSSRSLIAEPHWRGTPTGMDTTMEKQHPTKPEVTLVYAATSRNATFMLAVCLALALITVAVTAANASAGNWALVSCARPDGQPAPTEGWSTGTIGSIGPYSGDANTCSQGGQLSAVTSAESPQRAYEGPDWVFSAPAGSTIVGGTVTATLTSPHGQVWLATPNPGYDSADVFANCQYNTTCGQAGTLSDTFPITHTGGTHLYAAAVCVGSTEGAANCPATSGIDAGIYISAAEIKLDSDATPTAKEFGGPVLAGVTQGIQDLTFTASDPDGPGVYSVTATIDQATVYAGTPDSNGGRCATVGTNAETLTFQNIQPCKQKETIDLPIDTTALRDGQHTLKVTVEDAAKNTSTVYDGTITTHNATANTTLGAQPVPGSSTTGAPGNPNGAGASEQAQLSLGVPKTITRSYNHRALRITGRLLDSNGHPISGATLNVIQQPAGSPAEKPLASTKTAPNGTFTAAIPAGPSRTIEVAYRASSADAAYAARAKVQELVRASVQLSVDTRRTSASGTIILSGRVLSPVPAQGVVVEMLVHYRGTWVPFRYRRTDSRGRFDVVYEFQGSVGHFPFRALILAGQVGFPFAPSSSAPVDVATG